MWSKIASKVLLGYLDAKKSAIKVMSKPKNVNLFTFEKNNEYCEPFWRTYRKVKLNWIENTNFIIQCTFLTPIGGEVFIIGKIMVVIFFCLKIHDVPLCFLAPVEKLSQLPTKTLSIRTFRCDRNRSESITRTFRCDRKVVLKLQ